MSDLLSKECPECGQEFAWIDGKDKRRYAEHLESHLGKNDAKLTEGE